MRSIFGELFQTQIIGEYSFGKFNNDFIEFIKFRDSCLPKRNYLIFHKRKVFKDVQVLIKRTPYGGSNTFVDKIKHADQQQKIALMLRKIVIAIPSFSTLSAMMVM